MFYLAQYIQNIIISTYNHYKIADIDACLQRRKWQPTPVFLPGESHGQRSLVGCSPWGRKESDKTQCGSGCLLSHSVVSDSLTLRNGVDPKLEAQVGGGECWLSFLRCLLFPEYQLREEEGV